MKISVITVVLNAEKTIGDALESVASQTHDDVEHIVVDGGSSDRTLSIIKQYRGQISRVISEPDYGIYDAMNKGIKLASGQVIGILNADDIYQDASVLSQVAKVLADDALDGCYADLVYVKAHDLNRVTRYWQSRDYRTGLCFNGWMPAHPTFYLKRRVYDKVGLFNTELDYQADLEFCARAFERHNIRTAYIAELWVRMRLGGVTNKSLRTIWKGNWESYKALKSLGLKRSALTYFIVKWSVKLPQFFRKA